MSMTSDLPFRLEFRSVCKIYSLKSTVSSDHARHFQTGVITNIDLLGGESGSQKPVRQS